MYFHYSNTTNFNLKDISTTSLAKKYNNFDWIESPTSLSQMWIFFF